MRYDFAVNSSNNSRLYISFWCSVTMPFLVSYPFTDKSMIISLKLWTNVWLRTVIKCWRAQAVKINVFIYNMLWFILFYGFQSNFFPDCRFFLSLRFYYRSTPVEISAILLNSTTSIFNARGCLTNIIYLSWSEFCLKYQRLLIRLF